MTKQDKNNEIQQALVESLVRFEVQELSAYHVPDSSGMIKLDAMENPYLWSDSMIQEWTQQLQSAELNRYPDAGSESLRKTIRRVMNISDEFDIMLGNGSDELIQIIAMCLAKKDASIMSFEPSFVMYRLIASYVNMNYIPVDLNPDDFSIDIDKTLSAIRNHQPELIYIAYPNNPTGNTFDPMHLDKIIKEADGLVVIDEAYQPFADDSFISRLSRYPNVVLMRTLSKFGLAGLRLGYLIGNPQWLNEFNKVRLPYNINVLTQMSAEFALAHHDYFLKQAQKIKQARRELKEKLSAIEGVTVFSSRANFVLFKLQYRDADEVFNGLKAAGVLIKNLNKASPALADCLRVTVGKPGENKAFINALKALC